MPGFILSSRSVFVLVAVGVVIHAAVVRGESSPGAAAREAAEKARQASDAGRLSEAIEAYDRAYELSGETTFLFRLGEVNQKLGQDVAALRFYRSYLARDPRGKYREAAERAANALELKSSASSPAPASPPSPPPAPRSAPAAAPTPASASVPPPAPPPAPGPVAPVGPVAPRPATDLRADVTATPAPSASAPLPTWLSWAGVGATVALGAGAVATGLEASHRYDELRSSCGRTVEGCATADIDQVKSRARVANVLWAVTGVSAAATGIIVFVNAREVGFAGAWMF